jgi:hypothetical protein
MSQFRRTSLTLAFAALVVSGCATTQQAAINDNTYCPFMGAALCAKLTPTETPGRLSGAAVSGGGTPLAALRYVNSSASWTQYKSVMIQPVTFWGEDDEKLSAKDQLTLTNYFYQSLEKQLATKFQIATEPAPGVMRIQVALEDATTATPVLRSISMVIPQARALATLKYLATGKYPFVGSAQAEAKITDSETGQVLAAAVDRRVGGGALGTAAQWQLGDAENAINAWSSQMTERLASFTSGKPAP